MFKRAGFAALLIGVAIIVAACGGADHSWRGEFDARLEGAVAAIEARLPELRPDSTERELFTASQQLAHELAFKTELIRKLDPPDSCEEVQEAGRRTVEDSYSLGSVIRAYEDLYTSSMKNAHVRN